MNITCNCGKNLEYSGKPVICPECGFQNFFCPECGAPISIPGGSVAVSCPYCNASLVKEKIEEEQLFFPTSYDKSQSFAKLHWFLQNRFGIPEDIVTEFTPKNVKLYYIPVYVYRIKATLTEDIIEVDTKGIIGTSNVWFAPHISSYKFAVKSKIYYKADEIKGEVIEPGITKETAEKMAHDYGFNLASQDMGRFNIKGVPSIDVKYEGLIYYPMYEVEYLYRGQKFRGILDGANGVVAYAEYPMGTKTKLVLRTVGIFYMLLSGVIGFIEGVILSDLLSFIIVAGQGLVIGIGLIASARSRKKGAEEIKTTDKKIIVNNLNRKFSLPEISET